MLRLDKTAFARKAEWEAAGVAMPSFDPAEAARRAVKAPRWLHFGGGNIFRGYIARLQQRLLNGGKADWGIIAAEGYDHEIIEKIYEPHDNLALAADMRPDGTVDVQLVASVAEAIRTDAGMDRLREIARAPGLQIISFCITEKAYALTDAKGELLPLARSEMEKGPAAPGHTMALAAALLLERFKAGGQPVAMLSLDNCSRNGEKLRGSVLAMAEAWVFAGFADADFLAYVKDAGRVSFPWSMIDKITPRPSEAVRDRLTGMGIEGMTLLCTEKGTYIAPFVNAEVPQYLVVEDKFPAGRPPLEDAGVYFTDRQTVERVERMKVTTCLNPLHTALALFGCLLGHTSIAAEMKDPPLKALVERIGCVEGMPVVTDPGILSPEEFIREVLEERLPNPFIPDTPQRIATDTSQKMSIRFGETIKSYMDKAHMERQGLDDAGLTGLTGIPLVIAAWFRYLLGVDDELRPMQLSGDPMLAELQQGLAGVTAGSPGSYSGQLKPFLSNALLFGVDLFEAGLGEKIENLFIKMLAGNGSVRYTLEKTLSLA